MKSILISWVDKIYDINRISQKVKERFPSQGLIAALLSSGKKFDEVHLLLDCTEKERSQFSSYLDSLGLGFQYFYHQTDLADPRDYEKIYLFTEKTLIQIEEQFKKKEEEVEWHFFTSPGTKQMASVMILLAKTRYGDECRLYQSLIDEERSQVKEVHFPFKLQVFFNEKLRQEMESKLNDNLEDLQEFRDILHASPQMREIIQQAGNIAKTELPVLILGETGTGKEAFAKLIHAASFRSGNVMENYNCAGFTESIANSELFGHSRNAFTGAAGEHKGIFQRANGGTVFLDEIGELPLTLQAKMLRVLQEKKFHRVGDQKEIWSDIRIIAATNRNLIEMIESGQFREDLFYRLAIGIINLPPLRERGDDSIYLAKSFLEEANNLYEKTGYFKRKSLASSALQFILKYHWPGNARELRNTIERLFILFPEITNITDKEMKGAVILAKHVKSESGQSLPERIEPINLEGMLAGLRIQYIKKALDQCGGVKKEAARLLGYENYQTMDNQLKKREER